MRIPIENVYYLLAYSWNLVDEASSSAAGASQVDVPEDLFALVLRNGTDHLLKRGLDRAYRNDSQVIPGVRGRIQISESLKRNTQVAGRLVCEFDELTHDVLHNQILKATLFRLSRSSGVDRALAADLRDLVARFSDVSSISLAAGMFRQVQLHRNNGSYRLLMHVCQLVFRQLLPDQRGDRFRFADFTEDQLATIFESFVRNFLRREQSRYKVKREVMRWQDVSASDESRRLMPTMETDTSLIAEDHRIVVETKFYERALAKPRHGNQPKIRSAHLYQIFAYLKNAERKYGLPVRGVLLYPRVDADINVELEVQGYPLRVATLDLAQTPRAIGEELLGRVGLAPAVGS